MYCLKNFTTVVVVLQSKKLTQGMLARMGNTAVMRAQAKMVFQQIIPPPVFVLAASIPCLRHALDILALALATARTQTLGQLIHRNASGLKLEGGRIVLASNK